MKMLVIADDFTGANDTGVQLAKKGVCTEVMLNPQQKPSRRAQVLVVNTESRALTASDAAQAVCSALTGLIHNNSLIYKKIDSTFRGNIGAEIETILHYSGKSLALVAAAIPAAGRTTEQGQCLVNGIPVDRTEYASDPKTPITSACIRTIITQQSHLPVYEVSLAEVRSGRLAAILADYQPLLPESLPSPQSPLQPCVLVLDAVTDQDLILIARAAMSLHTVPLLVGAAGLASALPAHSWLLPWQTLPVLLVVGSMSEATRQQVNFVLAHQPERVQVVDIDASQLFEQQTEAYRHHVVQQATTLLNSGQHCLLRTSRHATDRDHISVLCQRWQLNRSQLGERLCQQIGLITLAIIENARIGGLFLTGGDIAIAVASALGARGYRIQSEVAPCVPCGNFINSEIDDLPVITKAGGFGNESILCDALVFIEEMYRE